MSRETDKQLAAIVEEWNRINPLRWDQDEQYRLAQARKYLRLEKLIDHVPGADGQQQAFYKQPNWEMLIDEMPSTPRAVSASTFYIERQLQSARSLFETLKRDRDEAERHGMTRSEYDDKRLFQGCGPVSQLDNGANVGFKNGAEATRPSAPRFRQLVGRTLFRLFH